MYPSSPSMPPSLCEQRRNVQWLLSWVFPTNSAVEGRSEIAGGSEAFCRRFLRKVCFAYKITTIPHKVHKCFYYTQTPSWTPKCHQTAIIYNSTSLFPAPPPTYYCQCVVMNSLILPFFYQNSYFRDKCPSFAVIKSAMSRTAVEIIVQCGERKKKTSMSFLYLGLLIRDQLIWHENKPLSYFGVTDHAASLFSYFWKWANGENAAFPSKEVTVVSVICSCFAM